MKIKLEVLAATPIKRKKPWSRIIWLGKDDSFMLTGSLVRTLKGKAVKPEREKYVRNSKERESLFLLDGNIIYSNFKIGQERESLFLLDGNRVSVLFVPSGKTKKTIQKLTTLLSETVFLTSTTDGLHLMGVQSSGEVFIWHKDSDELKTVCGLSGLLLSEGISLKGTCKLFSSVDCSQLLLIIDHKYIFLWQHSDTDLKSHNLSGQWVKVSSLTSNHLPLPDNKEATIDAVFFNSEVLGRCCQLSFIFNKNKNVHVTTLLIHLNKKMDGIKQDGSKETKITCTLSNIDWPQTTGQTHFEPINMQGAHMCQYTHDGQILAVGVNQKSPAHTCVLFVSPFIETVLVSDIKGANVKDPASKRGRQYWIADLKWTSDSLFLAVILNNGTAGLISRLGEPVILISKGCSLNLGPLYFLPFTPLISIQADNSNHKSNQVSFSSDFNIQHQKFSVSTHPSLPIVLFSDGYLVTIVQLPADCSQMIYMRDLVLESSTHLKFVADTNRLDLTLASAYQLPAGELESIKQSARGAQRAKGKYYSFEESNMSLNDTVDSEVSLALGLDEHSHHQSAFNVSSGKIVFAEMEAFVLAENALCSEPNDTLKALQLAKENLFNVWKLAASSTELWSANLDKVVNHAVHNIVKMFSLILDCPQVEDLLEEASGHNRSTAQVTTQSLFKVVSMYKLLVDLLQFDCQQHHLLPSVLQLSHKLSSTILSSRGLNQSDPRIKTLTGCFTLLKFTEKSLVNTYVVLPRNLKSKGIVAVDGEFPPQLTDKEMLPLDTELSKRLTVTWKLLHKAVMQFLSSNDTSAQDMRQAHTLRNAIQQTLGELGSDVDPILFPEIGSGERYSLDGRHTMAIQSWQKQLRDYPDSKKISSKLLHSLLYTYILRNDLSAGLSFVDSLISKAKLNFEQDLNPNETELAQNLQPSLMTFVTSTLRSQALHELDMVPCIRDRAIRQVVQSLARFMAAYFSNQTVFIFPPHNPAPLPAAHYETSIANSRIIPKYHEDIAAVIRHQKLSGIWTIERTLEYLLLSGLVCEAVWFADRMGDWKSAYQLSVAHVIHKKIALPLYTKVNKPLSLPDWLSPDAIMRRRLENLVKNDAEYTNENSALSHVTSILESIAMAGLMGYTEVGCWLLEQLVSKLKAAVKLFTPLVTKEFYLPAPPMFCPQPSRTEKHYSLDAEDESKLRSRVASILQLTFCVLNATHLSVPLVGWYVEELQEANKKAAQFKANIEGPCGHFPDLLTQYLETNSELYSMIEDSSVQSVMSSFRDLCSLLWLLHARDQLSMRLRTREKHLNLGLDVDNNDQWLRECFTALQWSVHLVPYSHYLSDEASIFKVMLALLQDLPATQDTANILAEYLNSTENLHPEVQERLERLMTSWQSIILKPVPDGRSVGDRLILEADAKKSVSFLGSSPRGLSLSVYFYKQCQVMDKVLKKKQQCFGSYEEFIFSEAKSELNIGSRPFETKRSFIDFLETFVDVCFTQLLELMAQKSSVSRLPLLHVFAEDIVTHEMRTFAQRAVTRSKSHGLSITSGVSQALNRATSEERIRQRSSSLPRENSPRQRFGREGVRRNSKPVGLFRGRSMIEIPLEKSHAVVLRAAESEPCLDDIQYFMGSEAGPSYRKAGGSHENLSRMSGSRPGVSRENLQSSSSREDSKANWSLTVNFGKKYTTLQQLVEWLELWGKKSLAFGLPGEDDVLDIPAKMRILIPAQLIILSLWLLEHKYAGGQQEVHKRSQKTRGRQSRRPSENSLSRQSISSRSPVIENAIEQSQRPPVHIEQGAKFQACEPEIYIQEPKAQISRPSVKEPRHSTPDQKLMPQNRLQQSMSSLDQQEIINAYTQALDGNDDSSSLEVSSLATDELEDSLRDTLKLLRESALNKTVFPKDESPERKKTISPAPAESLVPQVLSQPVQEKVLSGSGEANLEAKQGKQLSREVEIQTQHNVNVDSGQVTHQIQNVIRDEFRRILEVQQKSVLAMMGAIDGTAAPELVPATVIEKKAQKKTTYSPPSRSQSLKSEKSQQQPLSQKSQQVTSAVKTENKIQKPAVFPSPPYKPVQTRHMREALLELQNLQTEVTKRPENDPAEKLIGINKYFSEQTEESFKLPLLSFHAWTEQQSTPNIGYEMPLLQYNKLTQAQEPFKYLSHYLPQFHQNLSLQAKAHAPSQAPPQYLKVPPPLETYRHIFHHPPHMTKHLPPPPQQENFPSSLVNNLFPPLSSNIPPSYFTPFAVSESMPPPRIEIPHPQPPASNMSTPQIYFPNEFYPQNLPLLKLIPSDSSRSVVVETKQRLLQQFHQHVLNYKENKEETSLGENLQTQISEGENAKLSEDVRRQSSAEVQTSDVVVSGGNSSEEKVDASTSDTHINAGFALPRGIFESYLQLGEHLIGPEAANETNAAFQLKMALAMQRQIEKRIRTRVDFSTMTQEQIDVAMSTDPSMEVIRTAEAATSITKDIGVDPIQEVIREHNLKLHNNVLPPDIFMGLRFADQNVKPGGDAGKGRSYLNVVDIGAASVLRDIPERSNEAGRDQDVINSALLTSRQTVEQMGALEESLREKFQSRYSVVSPRKHDDLTVRMFTDLQKENQMSISIIPHSSLSAPKSAMIRHLQDMSNQMKAIDEMSQNIEREFKSSHLLLSTIQDVNASLQRSRSPSPAKGTTQKPTLQFSETVKEEKSSASITLPSTKASTSPQVSARSARSKTSIFSSRESLHGSIDQLSELIQEVMTKGGAHTGDFSEEIAHQVERDTREKLWNEYRSASDKLISMKNVEENLHKKTPEERESLKKWMMEKFHERQEEYMKKRNELIEREPKPFKSTSTITKLNLKTLEENLNEKRLNMASEFMDQRLIEAEQLMGNILVDKPEIPWKLDFQPKKRKVGSATTTTWKSPKKMATSPAWSRDPEITTPSLIVKSTKDSTPVKGILKTVGRDTGRSSTDLYPDNPALSSITEVDYSMDSSTDLINYAKRVLEMENRDLESTGTSFMELSKAAKQQGRANVASDIVSKAPSTTRKSYVSMVRLQRPETTRKWSELNKKRQRQDEREKLAVQQEAVNKSTAQSGKPKPMDSRKMSGPVVPRRVKTYSERLKEMKSKNKFSTQQSQVRGMPQRGSASVTSSLPKSSHTSIQTKTLLRSHGPLHKPQTYAEQLQNLRPHPEGAQSYRAKTSAQKTKVAAVSPASNRSRPYTDPYNDMDYEELASVMSDWDVDDNLRNIIYGGSFDFEFQSENQSDYFDDVMRNRVNYGLNESDELGAGDYQHSVDIEQIAEAASVASASILSVIDWDRIDDLIKDV